MLKSCIAEVMAEEGTVIDPDDVLVTTGGQQVIDLVCKTLIDPGDVIIAEAPTYPGAVPTFCSYQADVIQIESDADGMRIDVLEETLERLDARGPAAEVHLHGPDVPEPVGHDDVAAAPQAPRRGHPRARAARPRGQPVRAAALRGRPAADAATRSTAATSSSTSARSRRSSRRASGWAGASAPRPVLEKMNIGKQAADLCSSSLTQFFVAAYFASGRWQDYVALAQGDLPPPARRHARRARRVLRARVRVDAPAGRAVHLGDAARLHRHDRPARARARRARRVRARAARRSSTGAAQLDAAELLGRRRGRHPRGRSGASARSCASRSSSTAR